MAEMLKKGGDLTQDKGSDFSSETTYELNKTAVKDIDRSYIYGTDTVKDKVDEKKFDVTKETNKHSGEHEGKSLVETVREKAAEAYNYVAGGIGDSESKGLVGTVRGKAAEAYNYVAEKVSEATHAVTGDSNKDPTKDSSSTISSRVSAAVDAVKDKAIEVKSEVLK